jgi:HEAT repeat protein
MQGVVWRMNRRFSQIHAFSFRTLSMLALGAIVLATAFLSGSEKVGNDRKQIFRSTESILALSETGFGREPNDFDSAEQFRFSELAESILFPGSKTQDKANDDFQQLAAQLLDRTHSLKIRRQAAWTLAKIRSPEAFAVLRQALADAPALLKTTIAEALGNFDMAGSRELLRMLLSSDNDTVARGAMRGWAILGDNEALQLLADMLIDSQKGADLRTEAALSLSKVNSARAYQILVDSLNNIADREIATAIITGIGQRSFTETEPFFRIFLGRLDVPTELRVAALESLGEAEGNPVPLLLRHLESRDSRLRAASAWGLATIEGEGSADVRARIYQALENQSQMDVEQLLAVVFNDQAGSSRVAGLKLLASQVSRRNNQSLATEFDSVAVPQLEKLAINGADLQSRLISVMALKQARTPVALRALDRVAAQSAEPRIVSAAKTK